MCYFIERALANYDIFRSVSRKSLSFTDMNELCCVKWIFVQVHQTFQTISELLSNLVGYGFSVNDSHSKQWCSECSLSSIVCCSSRQLFTFFYNKQFSIKKSSLNLIGCVRLLFCDFSFLATVFPACSLTVICLLLYFKSIMLHDRQTCNLDSNHFWFSCFDRHRLVFLHLLPRFRSLFCICLWHTILFV